MKNLYFNMAKGNIKGTKNLYIPYMISVIMAIVLYFLPVSMGSNSELKHLYGGRQMKIIFGMIEYPLMIVSFFLILYANFFIIKTRSKEFGLYQVLGMRKKHIIRVFTVEYFIMSFVSMLIGLFISVNLDRLMFALTRKLMFITLPMNYKFSLQPVIKTSTVFLIMFSVICMFQIISISRKNIIDLLKSKNKGEKEPKAKAVIGILGLAFLIYPYYYVNSYNFKSGVLTANKFSMMIFSIVSVIIGTYLIFMSSTIFILKALKKNKKIYYNKRNFFGISNLLFKMKNNAVSLATICVLSTMILFTIIFTTTINRSLKTLTMLNRDYSLSITSTVRKKGENGSYKKVKPKLDEGLAKRDSSGIYFKPANTVEYYSKRFNFGKNKEWNKDLKVPIYLDDFYTTEQYYFYYIIDEKTYNLKAEEKIELKEDEVALGYEKIKGFLRAKPEFKNLKLYDKDYKVKYRTLERVPGIYNKFDGEVLIVVKDMSKLPEEITNTIEKRKEEAYNYYFEENIIYNYMLGEGSKEIKDNLEEKFSIYMSKINGVIDNIGMSDESEFSIDLKDDSALGFAYGGFFFMGLFFSMIFVVVSILILYFKQIAQSYEDRGKYTSLMRIGVSKKDIMKIVRRQNFLLFMLPIIVAVIHIIFASGMIYNLTMLLQSGNSKMLLRTILTVNLIYIVIYSIFYNLTSIEYYRVVVENKKM